MFKMVSFMLCIFYDLKVKKKKRSVGKGISQ